MNRLDMTRYRIEPRHETHNLKSMQTGSQGMNKGQCKDRQKNAMAVHSGAVIKVWQQTHAETLALM